jgi:ABC-type nitrate/sulfonate/bicarbonate transport system permease component
MKKYSLLSDSWPYALLVGLWYLSYWMIDSKILVPSPHDTVITLANYFGDQRFQDSVIETMKNLLLSWVLIQFLVLLSLILIQTSRLFESVFSKWALMFQTLPTFAVLPVLIALMGFNTVMMFTLLVFANYWVSISYLLTAQQEMRQRWKHHADNLQWSIIDQIKSVYFFALLPHLIAISAITWGLSWRTLIAVEVMFGGLGTASGLGVMMMEDRQAYNTSEVWAVLLVILAISVAINHFFDFLKKKIYW